MRTRCPVANRTHQADEHPDAIGYRALLREARSLVSLALRAAGIEATPGPDWRRRAKEFCDVTTKILEANDAE